MMFLANENQMKAGVAILKTEKIDFIMFKIIYLIFTVLFQIVASGGCSSCGAWASHCCDFSCCRAQALVCTGFSRCDTWAWLPHSMWDLPGLGIKPVSLYWQADS